MDQKDRLAANVAARKALKEIVELIEGTIPEVGHCRFWELLANEAADRAGMQMVPATAAQAQRLAGMDYEQALQFEKTVVQHGVHKGKAVRDIAPSYWVTVTESGFNRNLQQYMRSTRFLERQERE